MVLVINVIPVNNCSWEKRKVCKVFVRVCVRACVRVRACVHVCVCACACFTSFSKIFGLYAGCIRSDSAHVSSAGNTDSNAPPSHSI